MKQPLAIIIYLITLEVSLFGNSIGLQNDKFDPTSLQIIAPSNCADTILNDGQYPDITIHLLLKVNGDTMSIPDKSVFQLNFSNYCLNFPVYNNSIFIDSLADLSTREAYLIAGDLKVSLISCDMTFESVFRPCANNITLTIDYYSDFVQAKKDWGSYVVCDDIDTFKYFVLWGTGYVFDHVSVDCD